MIEFFVPPRPAPSRPPSPPSGALRAKRPTGGAPYGREAPYGRDCIDCTFIICSTSLRVRASMFERSSRDGVRIFLQHFLWLLTKQRCVISFCLVDDGGLHQVTQEPAPTRCGTARERTRRP